MPLIVRFLVWVVLLRGVILCCAAEAPSVGFTAKLTLAGESISVGDDLEMILTITPDDEQRHIVGVASFAQLAGIYILGPWGPMKTTIPAIHWMHGQASIPTSLECSRARPLILRAKLSEFFTMTRNNPAVVGDTEKTGFFLPGRYQVNVKFRASDLKMSAPIDTGPVYFNVLAAPK